MRTVGNVARNVASGVSGCFARQSFARRGSRSSRASARSRRPSTSLSTPDATPATRSSSVWSLMVKSVPVLWKTPTSRNGAAFSSSGACFGGGGAKKSQAAAMHAQRATRARDAISSSGSVKGSFGLSSIDHLECSGQWTAFGPALEALCAI